MYISLNWLRLAFISTFHCAHCKHIIKCSEMTVITRISYTNAKLVLKLDFNRWMQSYWFQFRKWTYEAHLSSTIQAFLNSANGFRLQERERELSIHLMIQIRNMRTINTKINSQSRYSFQISLALHTMRFMNADQNEPNIFSWECVAILSWISGMIS